MWPWTGPFGDSDDRMSVIWLGVMKYLKARNWTQAHITFFAIIPCFFRDFLPVWTSVRAIDFAAFCQSLLFLGWWDGHGQWRPVSLNGFESVCDGRPLFRRHWGSWWSSRSHSTSLSLKWRWFIFILGLSLKRMYELSMIWLIRWQNCFLYQTVHHLCSVRYAVNIWSARFTAPMYL